MTRRTRTTEPAWRIVCLGGLAKPSGSAADARDYRAIMQFASEFEKCRTVL